MTAREFAAQLGVNANTLSFWKYKLARETLAGRDSGPTPARVEFVEVTSAAPATTSGTAGEERLEVVCAGGRTVRVPRSFDPETLLHLVVALERR